MDFTHLFFWTKTACLSLLVPAFIFCASTRLAIVEVSAQSPTAAQTDKTPEVPDWALPGSATHKQYPPPKDFHRAAKTFDTKIGIFDSQSDIGGPLVPGSSSYDPANGRYTVNSAGYNIWYTRDEFRYLWKKMSGDVSLAATVSFPIPQNPPQDRKVVLVIRQDLDDDAKEVMVAEHGTGMVHLAQRPEKNQMVEDMQYRIGGSMLSGVMPRRIGIEKHGNEVALFMSVTGESMHQFGPSMEIHFDGPFYVGIGFCSHLPVAVDTGVFTDVLLENKAGAVS